MAEITSNLKIGSFIGSPYRHKLITELGNLHSNAKLPSIFAKTPHQAIESILRRIMVIVSGDSNLSLQMHRSFNLNDPPTYRANRSHSALGLCEFLQVL